MCTENVLSEFIATAYERDELTPQKDRAPIGLRAVWTSYWKRTL